MSVDAAIASSRLRILLWLVCVHVVCHAHAGLASEVSDRRSRPTSPRALPRYFFRGAVAERVEYDSDHDGKMDRWEHYDNGGLVRVEEDRDGDSRVDWREEHDGRRTGLYVRKIDGAYKFVTPFLAGTAGSDGLRGIPPSLIRTEKLLGDKWVDTFREVRRQCVGILPSDGPDMANEVRTYRNGRIVSVESTGSFRMRYLRREFKDGVISRELQGKSAKEISSVKTYEGGRLLSEEQDTNGDGKMDLRVEDDPKVQGRQRRLKLVNDGWSGDFTEQARTYRMGGRMWRAHFLYADGYLKTMEQREEGTNLLRSRRTYRKGFLLLEEQDRDLDGTMDVRRTYRPPDMFNPVEALALEDGRWVKDFVIDRRHARLTYVKGKLYRMEQGRQKDGTFGSVTVFVSEHERHWGENGKISQWHHYRPGGRVEKRDLDGDGRPDLIIDYVRLTIEKVEGEPVPVP